MGAQIHYTMHINVTLVRVKNKTFVVQIKLIQVEWDKISRKKSSCALVR